MPEKKIRVLLEKYLEGRATPEEEKLVDDWYDSLSTKNDYVHLSDGERRFLKSSYWNAIKQKIRPPAGRSRKLWPGLISIAASVTAIVLLTLFVLPPHIRDKVSHVIAPIKFEKIVNNTSATSVVLLPDSSRVTLSPGSSLEYPERFNEMNRDVHLVGQAFFDISHNKEKPFYVFANEVVTKVLGTSFRVIAYPSDVNITVAVKTGKVSVYTQSASARSEADNIVLTPNQQAVYSKSDNKVSLMLVEDPQVVITKEEVDRIRFEGVPVSQIFLALEKMYNVDIDFDEEIFSKCSVTTSGNGKDLYERVDVICEITGASYIIENTTIKITGTGCK